MTGPRRGDCLVEHKTIDSSLAVRRDRARAKPRVLEFPLRVPDPVNGPLGARRSSTLPNWGTLKSDTTWPAHQLKRRQSRDGRRTKPSAEDTSGRHTEKVLGTRRPSRKHLRARPACCYTNSCGRATARRAEVAELADALRSGRSGGNPVGVQISPSAPPVRERVRSRERCRAGRSLVR